MGEDPTRINEFLDLVFSYGPFWVYLVLFAACFIENIFPPFPGDSFIVAAGALVGVERLGLVPAMVLVLIGGMGSVMLLYTFGRRYGRDFFMRKNYRYFSVEDIVNIEGQFQKWGVLILVFSRFVVGFRSGLALVAGMSRYNSLKMLVFSTISYIMFSGLLMYGAIKLVENLDVFRDYFQAYNMIVWPILIILLALYIIRKFRNLRKGKR